MKKFSSILLAGLLAFTSCGLFNQSTTTSTSSGSGNVRTYTFRTLPQNVQEMKALPEASLKDPYAVAALSVVALMQYEKNQAACYEMLDFLRGPDPLSTYTKQFMRDRLQGKFYKIPSYFNGATPANNYTPSKPYTIRVSSNQYSFQTENWATLWLTSGGADNPRSIKLRQKPSTGQWFVNDIQYLSDIRTPASEDPWK